MKIQLRSILTALTFLCLATVGPQTQAVTPAPDGGYPAGNTAEGQAALFSLSAGGFNTAVGFLSLRSDSTGGFNTAIGAGTLLANTANSNTATGAGALLSNTTGTANTANGAFALFSNINGDSNNAFGFEALFSNTTGSANTANGSVALFSNTTGYANTANGSSALATNTTGFQNTADGAFALLGNTTGNNNTADGYGALSSNTTSDYNTATGYQALGSNTTGSNNTADGYQSLANNTTGSFNVALAGGFNLTGGDFNIDIGNDGVDGDSGVIRIGSSCCQSSTFIAGIYGVTASGGAAVYVNSSGQLGTLTSSARFKEEIKPMNNTSEAILGLRPVTFRYKKQVDPARTSQFGLVAEDVEKVNPDLVVHDKEGNAYSVRYEAVNAMLLNEFLKEHRRVERQERQLQEQQETISQLKSNATEQAATTAKQQKQIEALTSGLQKVTAQLDMSRSAPQVVGN